MSNYDDLRRQLLSDHEVMEQYETLRSEYDAVSREIEAENIIYKNQEIPSKWLNL